MSQRHLYRALNTNIVSRQPPAELRPIPALLPRAEREPLRKLPFEKMHNFRELGGYQTGDGKTVKWGMIYRSDKICGLTEADQHYLERLKLARIVDFRSDEERYEAPHSLLPDSEIAIQVLPITVEAAEVDKMLASLQREGTTAEEMAIYLLDANRDMIERFTPIYRQWMQDLLKPENYPQVFHCTAGKDRTGLAAVLLLRALGVPEEVAIADYLATNDFTADRIDTVAHAVHSNSMFQVGEEVIRVLFSVQPKFIGAAIAAMEVEYGSFDNYLELGLGITADKREQLQTLLLEDAPQ